MTNLSAFPDNSRVWFFPLKKRLSAADQQELHSALQGFIHGWQAHKQQLAAGIEILESQIVLVVTDEARVKASGCSIDSLTNNVEGIVGELGQELARASEVLFFRNGEANCCSRAEFQKLVENKDVTLETEVLNTTLSTLGEVRAGLWRCQAAKSWHGGAFF